MTHYYLEGEHIKQFPLLTELLQDEQFAVVEQQAFWTGDGKALHEALMQLLWVANDAVSVSLEYVFYSTRFGKHRLLSSDSYRMMSVVFGETNNCSTFVTIPRSELKPVVNIVKISRRAGIALVGELFYLFGWLKDGRRWMASILSATSTKYAFEEFAQLFKTAHLQIEQGAALAALAKDGVAETMRKAKETQRKIYPKMLFVETSVQFPLLSDRLFSIPGAKLLRSCDAVPANPKYFTKLPNAPVEIQFPIIEHSKIYNHTFLSGPLILRWNYLDLPYTYIVMPISLWDARSARVASPERREKR